jgi:hypothetical protein
LSVNHDDNNPRTQAFFHLRSVRYDAGLNALIVDGRVVHVESTGDGTFISKASGNYSVNVPVDNVLTVFLTVQNQKGIATLAFGGIRPTPSDPATLRIQVVRQAQGSSDNRRGVAVWIPYRVWVAPS